MDPRLDWLLSVRARANALHRPVDGTGPAAAAEVVRRTAGLQAQSWPATRLAVRARSTATGWSDLDRAREDDRSVLRGWFMRGTLHLVSAEDAGWLLGILGPVALAGTERRHGELGLTQDIRERSLPVLERALTERGPLDRAQLGEVLVGAGLLAQPSGQGLYALIRHAGLRGVLCYGPSRDGETWVAVRDWFGAPFDLPAALAEPGAAVAELARRYLAGYGPASPADFATWSGLPGSVARAGFHGLNSVTEVRVGGHVLAALDPGDQAPDPPGIRLLGGFDPYLLGYRSRELMVDPAYRKRVNAGGGMISPVVLASGRVIGTWRPDARRGTTSIDLFEPGTARQDQLAAEIADLARFRS